MTQLKIVEIVVMNIKIVQMNKEIVLLIRKTVQMNTKKNVFKKIQMSLNKV